MPFKSDAFYSEIDGDAVNVVDGLFAIAASLAGVAQAIYKLGLADASTPMGAIESLSLEMRDGFSNLCAALMEREP